MQRWFRAGKSALVRLIALGAGSLRSGRTSGTAEVIDDEFVDPSRAPTEENFRVESVSGDGWHAGDAVARHVETRRLLLEDMYTGRPRQDLVAAAGAVQFTGVENPTVLEVGCGSGFHYEVLSHLLGQRVQYSGMDLLPEMLVLGRDRYPVLPLIAGDPAALPFVAQTFDVILTNGSLMSTVQYEAAISESARVSRRWCIFHAVPVLRHRRTTMVRKLSHQDQIAQVIFNERHFYRLLAERSLKVRRVIEGFPLRLETAPIEPAVENTYVCEKARNSRRSLGRDRA